MRVIKTLSEKNEIITVKKIRQILNIKSSNRSKINFIWRRLKFIHGKGFLEYISSKPAKIYKLRDPNPIDINKLITQAKNQT